MIHRVGLFIASLAAAGTLVAALSLAGFAPGRGPASDTAAAAVGQAPAAVGIQPDPQVQVDTMYLAAPEKPADVTVHHVIPATTSGEGEGHEHEGGGD